ncbi:DUF1569 domain-containing protein [Alteromonas flava]|uniref:DUF1569 domain-containing protein n=1 Tax=Alteromonas flava TaxID=2048003 RepID=UPI000C281C6B|nr:DUF1569 domain-containing protein [Alteromonas flava]
MQRRTFLKSAGLAALVATTTACADEKASQRLNVTAMIDYLRSLKLRQALLFNGPWPAFATFTHLAQSIEFAMTGFPEHKSDGFKRWVGQPAFWVFKQAGAMQHDTAEAIPGAPALDVMNTDPVAINQSIDRLILALSTFATFTATQPHFAYGDLSHDDYMLAQLMHINDHLTLLN